MKIIKKIAAIMLSVMMVLGMCSVVGAEGTTTSGMSAANKGKITINKAIKDQTYTIYQILELESFSEKPTTGATNTGNYAYKVASEWNGFFTSGEKGADYVMIDGAGYVTWNTEKDAAAFAKDALAYAKKNNIHYTKQQEQVSSSTITFDDLKLGYYLVDSSVGALCSLNTTDTEVTIEEKNAVPSVKKEVQEDSKGNSIDAWGNENTADIGQTVNFKTTITAQPGAQSYVLHDKMSEGLTFDKIDSVKVGNITLGVNTDYEVTDSKNTGDGCAFHITFTSTYCESIKNETNIVVSYSAILNDKAKIKTDENKNETWLKYGESNNLETAHKTTTTKTYEIPVFKYTNKNGTKKALAGAEFTLTRDGETVPIKLVKVAAVGASDDVYRVAMKSETGETVIRDGKVTTSSTGKFTIKGLDAGIYYLTETKQPDGYNKLTSAVKIEITSEGKIKVKDGVEQEPTEPVKVENKTGSILPSTGGMGTTLFYIFGAILVIGSGVVLITKKRMK